MARADRRSLPPFSEAVAKWRHVKGAPGVTKPPELSQAELLDAICRRWPAYTMSAALAEDAGLLLQTVGLLALMKDDDG